MKFSIPFNFRGGDGDLKTLSLNHLSQDIQKKPLRSPRRKYPQFGGKHNVEHCPGRTYNLFENTSLLRFTHLKQQGRMAGRKKEPMPTKADRRLPNCHELQRWGRMIAQRRRRGGDRCQRLS